MAIQSFGKKIIKEAPYDNAMISGAMKRMRERLSVQEEELPEYIKIIQNSVADMKSVLDSIGRKTEEIGRENARLKKNLVGKEEFQAALSSFRTEIENQLGTQGKNLSADVKGLWNQLNNLEEESKRQDAKIEDIQRKLDLILVQLEAVGKAQVSQSASMKQYADKINAKVDGFASSNQQLQSIFQGKLNGLFSELKSMKKETQAVADGLTRKVDQMVAKVQKQFDRIDREEALVRAGARVNPTEAAIPSGIGKKAQEAQDEDTTVKTPPTIYKKLLAYRKWCIDKKNIWQGLYNFGFWSLLLLWITLTFLFYGKDMNETGLFAVKAMGLLWYVIPVILRFLAYVGIAIFVFRVCITLVLRIWNKEVIFWDRKDKLIRMGIELALQVILATYLYEQFHLIAMQVYNWKSILLGDISGEIQYYIRYVINQWRVLK